MIVTNKQRTDGFGAIFQNLLYILVWAADKGYKFMPSFNRSFEHNYNNDPEFVVNLNKFMGFNFDSIASTQESYSIVGTEMYPYVEQNIERLFHSDIFRIYKNHFFSIHQSSYDINYYNVAIHVRRRNQHDSRISGTDTPNEYYLSIMNKVRNTYTGNKELKFHIFSQGAEENFTPFLFNDVVLHLNTSTEQTFLGLSFSDELITSASSLSYTAALLTNGIVHYKSFWHPPLCNWIKY